MRIQNGLGPGARGLEVRVPWSGHHLGEPFDEDAPSGPVDGVEQIDLEADRATAQQRQLGSGVGAKDHRVLFHHVVHRHDERRPVNPGDREAADAHGPQERDALLWRDHLERGLGSLVHVRQRQAPWHDPPEAKVPIVTRVRAVAATGPSPLRPPRGSRHRGGMPLPPQDEEGLIAFGDDRSPHAETAWQWIRAHRWRMWHVDVLTATSPQSALWSWDQPPHPVMWQPPDPRRLGPGSPLATIRHLTDDVDPRVLLGHQSMADLLVVGPRGLGTVRAALLGGTTEWLLHHAPAPLAIIRDAARVQRVLVCVDGSAHARAALEAFVVLPWSADTEAVVLGVYDRWSDIERGERDAHKVLADAGITARSVRARGKPAPAILQQIDVVGPQLVVMGTRGLNPWKRLLLGATAGTVVHAAGCSVLVATATRSSPSPDPA